VVTPQPRSTRRDKTQNPSSIHPATKKSSLSATSTHPATIRICGFGCLRFVKLHTAIPGSTSAPAIHLLTINRIARTNVRLRRLQPQTIGLSHTNTEARKSMLCQNFCSRCCLPTILACRPVWCQSRDRLRTVATKLPFSTLHRLRQN